MKDPAGKPGLPPGGGIRLFTAVLLLLGGIGLAVYAFASRSSAVNEGARTALTIFGIVFGVGMSAGAYALVRSVFPPRAKHVKISVPVTEVKRGGDVEVRLEIANPEKAAENLELGLVCDEFYDVETTD